MEAVKQTWQDLKIGAKMSLDSIVSKHPRLRLTDVDGTDIAKTAAGFAVAVAIVALTYPPFTSNMEEQERSEAAGVAKEAEINVLGYAGVESTRHGQMWPAETRDSARLNLEDGSSCTVYFRHEKPSSAFKPSMGADVTDWGSCPLKEDN